MVRPPTFRDIKVLCVAAHPDDEVLGVGGTLEQSYLWGSGYLQSAYYFRNVSLRLRKRRPATDGGIEATQEDEGREERETDDGEVRPPMGRLVLARIIDGLYPTTILVLLALSLLGVTGFEIVAFLVLWESSLYVVLGLATRSERLHLLRDLVPFLALRLLVMPVGTYTYLRVAVDVLSGNRSWRK